MRLAADAGSVPDESAILPGRVQPGRFAAFEPALNRVLRLAKQNRNFFVRMLAVTDEEWYYDDVGRARQTVTIANTRFFLHERRVDFGIEISRADQFNLPFDSPAGVFIVARAMAGDEQCCFGW